ncbi:GntR family transcriptional regulator [Mycolicibacterium sp. S2-37]|uniref:GntR family transcriptional regulator n=1 Tax=Mycolicibacterium sp. S2-37 TaxID=2810297 RepID=UPI001A93F8BF|nr:GntR family transcriptional regulator [Mycolicibacterium sp. S2-37]MBO0679039.1 GntR family transcriptional regulator [Mycolicibacterium sp. S2-37]
MPVPAERGKHKRSLLREQAYVSLRDAIIDGTLAPGERLRDPDLEAWLGVSRTPIREALNRLEAAGLVHTEPGRLTVVSTIDAKAAVNAQNVAAAMHALAVRTAVPLLAREDLEAMTRANQEFAAALSSGDVAAAIRSDDDFHRVAVDASGNDVIAQVLEQVTPLLRRLEHLRFSSLSGRESIAQHDEIIELCRRGDADAAADAAQRNWQTLSVLAGQDGIEA